ncbi:peptidyl-prolyl cis-trans isomerase [Reichenbachiella carrageenanivorans]|uniref:Peptidyl-prolyl cis-trans isomerase n=1 Tax=Reichenbachiella carrageenanivorans TaxID=2979869 RepID=A0ABY6D2T5_9BACT|nr:peptidylprolyl isomerase [Reichenbachiella carrageenanivorans]UXX80466.1 peptidyl-prolyl cis-trans isomerase [Reichenbachiella carrageenanivorans]
MIQSTRFSSLLFLLVLPLLSFAQSNEDDQVLFQLDSEPYGIKAFNYYFLKNAEEPSADSAKIKVNEYLDLYVNFRLKVKEAIAQGQDQTPEFKEEFEGYKKQLAEPYLMQTKVNEQMVAEAYQRLTQEVSASHILIKSDEQANPEDTLKAYNKALDIKNKILAGADFETLASQVSDDPSAKQNGGSLGYFSALQMVYPFENAVYQNQIGDIVGPVKTRFGYHIIKINDKRKARGQVLVAHIMIRAKPDSLSMATAKSKAASIYDNLKKGASWDEQCKLYSDDVRTKPAGGKLQWFGTGQLVPTFEDAAFALKETGDISEPVQTRFGYHIIKLIDQKGIASFEEMQSELETKISRDSRAKDKKSVAITKLKESQYFEINPIVFNQLANYFDSTLLTAQWNNEQSQTNGSKVLFTTNNTDYTLQLFFDYVEEKQKKRKLTALDTYVNQLYNQFVEKSIFDEELELIEAHNYDYQMVLDEYRSGILLFNLMETEVWNKAMVDSIGLQEFYDKNKKKNYKLAEHVVVRRFVSKDSSVLQSVSTQLDKTNSELDSLFNSQEPLTLQTFEEKIEQGKNKWLDDHWAIGSSVQSGKNYFTLWHVVSIQPDGYKPLTEIKGLVISDYQHELEKQWLKALSKKYPMKLNKSVLKSYIEGFED